MSSLEAPSENSAKLPLGTIITSAYSTYFQNFGSVLKICWLWLIISAPLIGYAAWVNFSWVAGFLHSNFGRTGPITLPGRPWIIPAFLYGSNLLLAAAVVSIAIAWHRKVLLNEGPAISVTNVASRSFWRYVLALVLMVLLSCLPVLLVGFFILVSIQNFPADRHITTLLGFGLSVILAIAMATCLLRLKLILPARAVDDRNLTFGETWTATQGNTWRLFWGYAATLIPPLLIGQIATFLFVGRPTPANFLDNQFLTRLSIAGSLSTAFYVLVVPIYVGFLSLAYRFLLQPDNANVRPYTIAGGSPPTWRANLGYLAITLLIVASVIAAFDHFFHTPIKRPRVAIGSPTRPMATLPKAFLDQQSHNRVTAPTSHALPGHNAVSPNAE